MPKRWPDDLVRRARELHAQGMGAYRIHKSLSKDYLTAPSFYTIRGWISGNVRRDA